MRIFILNNGQEWGGYGRRVVSLTVWASERYAAEHQTAQTAQTAYPNKVKKMLIKWKKSEKEVFGKLVAQGNDLYVSGSGYHFNGKCFKSFREFWKFCQDQLDK